MKNIVILIALVMLSCVLLSAQNPDFNYIESDDLDGTFVEHNGLIFQIKQEPTENNSFGKVTICPWTVGGEDYKYKGDIVIPKAIQNGDGDFADKYRVTTLEDGMFDDCDELTSVVFPEDMSGILIQGFSFKNTTKLKSVSLPKTYKAPTKYKSKYLDERAFLNSGIEEIIIPEGFEYIGNFAFAKSKLKKINLPESLTGIGDGAFFGTLLTTISLPLSIRRIGGATFQKTLLSEIKLPKSISEIGSYAFAETPLTNVDLPQSLTMISDGAFAGTPISTITFNSQCIPQFGGHYNSGMFYNCPNLTEVIFVQPIEKIPKYFFRGLASDKLTIMGDIKELGEECFSYSKLSSLYLPKSVEIIGKECFNECKNLQYIELPDNLKILRSRALLGTGIKTLTVPKNIESIEYYGLGVPSDVEKILIKCPIEKIPTEYLFEDNNHTIPSNKVIKVKNK